MAFVPSPQVCEAEIEMVWDGQIVENTLYFQSSAAMDVALMGTLAAALITWWNANIKPGVADTLGLTAVAVTDLTTNTSPAVLTPVSPTSFGAGGAQSLPNNVALCISFRTAARGRTSRGRNYIPGLMENQVNQNTVIPAVPAAFIAAYEELIGPGTFVPGLQWGVLSRRVNNADRISGLFRPITSVAVVDSTVDSQRRRLPGRGR